MDPKALKIIGVVCLVICAVLIFVAVERYQTNAKNVQAIKNMGNSMPFGNSGPFGNSNPLTANIEPATPAATKYAAVFAVVFAGAAIACFVMAGKASADKVSMDYNQNSGGDFDNIS